MPFKNANRTAFLKDAQKIDRAIAHATTGIRRKKQKTVTHTTETFVRSTLFSEEALRGKPTTNYKPPVDNWVARSICNPFALPKSVIIPLLEK